MCFFLVLQPYWKSGWFNSFVDRLFVLGCDPIIFGLERLTQEVKGESALPLSMEFPTVLWHVLHSRLNESEQARHGDAVKHFLHVIIPKLQGSPKYHRPGVLSRSVLITKEFAFIIIITIM